jgi:hypothetical protein
MLTVRAPTFSNVVVGVIEKYTGVWSMLITYLSSLFGVLTRACILAINWRASPTFVAGRH